MPLIEVLRAELPVILRIALAMGLAAIIGVDREMAGKPAGLRTHMLVAGAASLFVPLGATMVSSFASLFDEAAYRADPLRIIESVITGISFLGAGTIIHRKDKDVEGLTTAASILFTAGLGVAVALNRIVLSIAATGLVFVTLKVVGLIENRLWKVNNGEEGKDHA